MFERYTSRTGVRKPMRGLWPMAAEPGLDFRWGVLLRRSKFNRAITEAGETLLFEESTSRQELEVVWHIRDNDMGVIVEVYKDIASGWKPGAPRPRFKHALVDLASGKIDGIAVLNIDRLTRRRDQVRPILNALEEMGGRLFSLEDDLDTADDDPESNTELRLYQLVERAEREARRTSERMRLVARHRARAGLVQRGGVRPFGHTMDWTATVPEEVELIEEAVGRILKGQGYWTVAQDFNHRGHLTPQGKLWTHASLRYVLRSPRLVAKRRSNGSLLPYSDVPAIVDEETWLKLQAALDARSYQQGRRETHQASNIVLCAVCDAPLIGNRASDGRPSYTCRKNSARPNACGGISATVQHVDDVIDPQVVEFLSDPRRVAALLERYRVDTPETAALDARFAELQESKVALEEAAFNPPAGMRRLPRERYWELREQIEREQEQLQRKRIVNREAEPLKAAAKRKWTLESWRSAPMEWRRTILALVTERIEIHPAPSIHRQGLYGTEFDPDRVKIKFAA